MKIHCPCGAVLPDQTDGLPWKAHVVPDQDWDPLLDAIDRDVLLPLEAGEIGEERAAHRARHLVGRVTRLAYQCYHCGRLYIEDGGGTLHRFDPAGPATSMAVLRGEGPADGQARPSWWDPTPSR